MKRAPMTFRQAMNRYKRRQKRFAARVRPLSMPRAVKYLAAIVAAIAFLIALLAGCARPVPIAARSVGVEPVYCFDGMALIGGKPKASMGCFADAPLCAKALSLARRYGSLADVVSLTPCHRRTP